METYIVFFMSVVLAIIGFFIVRFFNSVDQIKKSLDAINIKLAIREENITEIKKELHEIKMKQQEHSKRLHDIEMELSRTNNL